MDIFKMIARLTESYFYLCIFLGFFASIFLCSSCVLKSWNIFVNSKNDFLEWLKVWKCKEYIKEKYNFALRAEITFQTALEYIDNKEIRQKLYKTWKELKHAE